MDTIKKEHDDGLAALNRNLDRIKWTAAEGEEESGFTKAVKKLRVHIPPGLTDCALQTLFSNGDQNPRIDMQTNCSKEKEIYCALRIRPSLLAT